MDLKPAAHIIHGTNGWWSIARRTNPAIATELLTHNINNRPIRRLTVLKYTEIMRQDRWILTPEPIMITKEGRLINGQHRLTAVIQSGTTQTFLMTYGVDEEVYHALDRGAIRSVADATRLDRRLVEASRVIIYVLSPISHRIQVITDEQIVDMASVIGEEHDLLLDTCGTARPVFSSAAFRAAACLRLLDSTDPDYVLNTYANLCRGRITDLSPIAQSAVGNVAGGKFGRGVTGNARQEDHLLRAWDIFNPDKRDNTFILIKNAETRVKEMRRVVSVAQTLRAHHGGSGSKIPSYR